jgi:hypothetical protein
VSVEETASENTVSQQISLCFRTSSSRRPTSSPSFHPNFAMSLERIFAASFMSLSEQYSLSAW